MRSYTRYTQTSK